MRYAKILSNDVVNSDRGFCVSVWMQGCNHHCKGCFNPETWDPNGGKEIEYQDFLNKIIKYMDANGVSRHLSILGGDPLAPNNLEITTRLCYDIKTKYPDRPIYLWTGDKFDKVPPVILALVNVIIDGEFVEQEKDLSLKLRGSRNQHIYEKVNNIWYLKE